MTSRDGIYMGTMGFLCMTLYIVYYSMRYIHIDNFHRADTHTEALIDFITIYLYWPQPNSAMLLWTSVHILFDNKRITFGNDIQ